MAAFSRKKRIKLRSSLFFKGEIRRGKSQWREKGRRTKSDRCTSACNPEGRFSPYRWHIGSQQSRSETQRSKCEDAPGPWYPQGKVRCFLAPSLCLFEDTEWRGSPLTRVGRRIQIRKHIKGDTKKQVQPSLFGDDIEHVRKCDLQTPLSLDNLDFYFGYLLWYGFSMN